MSDNNSSEIWKPVLGYENGYSASSHGRIRREQGGLGARSGRILRHTNTRKGYSLIGLHLNGHRSTFSVHRLVLNAFIGARPDMECNHKNGIRDDNRLENLEWCTPSENLQHAYETLGRKAPRGERSGKSKLTTKIVEEIRTLKGKKSLKELSKMFGISFGHIGKIMRNEYWTATPGVHIRIEGIP